VDQHRSRTATTAHTGSDTNYAGHANLRTDRGDPGRCPNHPRHREPGGADSHAVAADSDSYRHANEDANANLDTHSEAPQADGYNAAINWVGRRQDQPVAVELVKALISS
jgi:hypothetical protein